ncbi:MULTISPECIES: cell wall-binding repeat-containing protein [unclassified Leucobacter]|uniref:cell wall-binding repeat-containing protein n=1 Tax=unclassified Leucobacter TaxID=2621730 RepID=UPI00130436BA|nr:MULTISPECIES: cell wall-binding repeat-containing protein [unclassified Leucobacter]
MRVRDDEPWGRWRKAEDREQGSRGKRSRGRRLQGKQIHGYMLPDTVILKLVSPSPKDAVPVRITRKLIGPALVLGLTLPLTLTTVEAAHANPTDETGAWFTTEVPPTGVGTGTSTDKNGVTRSRFVALDADAAVRAVISSASLARAKPGERIVVPKQGDLRLGLFDGETLEVTVAEVAVTLDAEALSSAAPTIEVIGHTANENGVVASSSFTFVPDQNGHYSLHGNVTPGDGVSVAISPAGGRAARLDEIDADLLPMRAGQDVTASEAATATPPTTIPTPKTTPTVIDLLVGYSDSLPGGDVRADVQQQVTRTNEAFVNSGINTRLNLVAAIPSTYSQNGRALGTVTRQLMDGWGVFSELHSRRDAVGADLVMMIVPDAVGAWGWGNIPPRSGYDGNAFSVVAYDTIDHELTFTHEIGHNLGGNHDRTQSGKEALLNYPYPFSHGHLINGVVRDLMSYERSCTDGCPATPQFSNPGIDFIGHPGKPSGTGTENNALSINLIAPHAASYRDRRDVIRVAGANRYATAAKASQHRFTNPANVKTVVVAPGLDFPDALSGAPLAAKLAGPLLLTAPTALPAETRAEITRLKPTKILVLGGTGVVSASVESTLKTLTASGGSVTRLSGADRYATSLAIAKHGWPTAPTVFVATGLDYPDALSAGSAAGKLGAPVVLVPGTAAALPTATKTYLAEGTKHAYIAGGKTIVSTGIETNLKAYGPVTRYAASDRFGTSALIAKAHHTVGGSIYLANGLNFPDALSGAAIAGQEGAPLMLARQNCVLPEVNEVQSVVKPSKLVLLGGVTLLANTVADGTTCG